MKVFIVFAHPEPRSFGAALLKQSIETLNAQGRQVVVSDLYSMGFTPIASASDFTERRFPDMLHYDREQKYAHEHNAFSSGMQQKSTSCSGATS